MKDSFCELVLNYLPRESEVEDLYSANIANCVFNSFLCYTAIMLNIVTIHAIRKNTSLPKTLKTLLLSLAVSDVSVGLLVQPFYTSLLIKWLKGNNPGCNTYKAFYFTAIFFSLASFCGVLAVGVDRFLAIHLHLRYQELVTHKRVVAVVMSIWLFSVFVSFLLLWVPLDIYSLVILIIVVFGLVISVVIYSRIYLAVTRHRNQMQALQVQHVDVTATGETTNFSSLIKSAVGIFYLYLVFLVCYLPYIISSVAIEVNGPTIVFKNFFLFSCTLVYLNSSLNPVIYCWKMRHIRHAVIDIFRKISWHRSRSSHEPLA